MKLKGKQQKEEQFTGIKRAESIKNIWEGKKKNKEKRIPNVYLPIKI